QNGASNYRIGSQMYSILFILTGKRKLLVLCTTFAISNPMFCACRRDNVSINIFETLSSLVTATSMEKNNMY
ncbi:hypothetical protein ACQP3C_31235, partial [Escherichia coli]